MRVKCKLCNERGLDPINTNDATKLNKDMLHWTMKHPRELQLFIQQNIQAVFGEDLYPLYLEFYPDGDLLTAHVEVWSLILDFIEENIEKEPDAE